MRLGKCGTSQDTAFVVEVIKEMFCPGCGAKNLVEQKFCRSCGVNLEGTTASLLEQFPDGTRSDLQRKEQSLDRFGSVAFTGFGIVIGVGLLWLLYYIFERMVLSGKQPVPGILLIAFIIFAGLSLGYVFWREHLSEKRSKLGKSPNAELPTATTGKLLEEPTFEPVPSVVEHTTELLTKIPRSRAEK